jgi:uncharacterized membrane protein
MRQLILRLAGPVFTGAGILHFITPRTYEQIMPPWLPAHRELVYASGVAEAAGGLALMHPDARIRKAGGLLEAATMIGVFPANVHMAANPHKYPQVPGGKWALYARLPLQLGFIAWCLAAGARERA